MTPIRAFLSVLLLFACGIAFAAEAVPGQTWQMYATPEEAGWSAEKLAEAREYYDSLQSAAAMVIQGGAVVLAWGDVERRYMCHSVRKSFMSAMIGVAVDAGKIDMQSTLGQLKIDDLEPGLTETEKKARVVDLITARSGVYRLAAYEPMSNPKPQRGAHEPGTNWCYNNWDFNVLLTIYEQQTGGKFFENFDRYLARPLGMQDFRVFDGYYHYERHKSIHPAYPFKMSTRDMARFGLLYLREGMWGERRVLSADWVRKSRASHSDDAWYGGYGYLWWIIDEEPFGDLGMYSALGLGDQSIEVIPSLDLVFVHRTDTYAGGQVRQPQRLELLRRILAARVGVPKAGARLVPLPASRDTEDLPPVAGELKRYAHGYTDPDGFTGKVTLEREGLVAHTPFGNFRLLPSSETRFVVEDIERPAVFELDENGTPVALYTEQTLNAGGYRHLQVGNTKRAIEIFEKAVALFPDSFNVYDSLGEAHALSGSAELAIRNFERSVQLNPDNENAIRALERLRKTNPALPAGGTAK